MPQIPRYDLRERLGEGATSIVYRAWDRELDRHVAVKVLRETVGLSEIARARFRREAHAAAALAHPNLVTVFDAGEVSGQLYMVMELVQGRPLSDLLREGRSDQKILLRILCKAALGVAAAHRHDIVHRDLKPANILIDGAGEPKVGDFGLAHMSDSTPELTRTGTPLGTPLYMSPEQVDGRNRDISPRTDVYALGAVLYETLTGRPPYSGESIAEVYGNILRGEVVAPRHVPKGLQAITLKALDKDPARRYPTADEFAEDLRRFLDGEPVLARPTPLTVRLALRVREKPTPYALGALAVAALIAAAWIWRSAAESERRLQIEREAGLDNLRKMARVSLDAALQLRRRGDLQGMRPFLPPLATAYEEARRRAPDLAEVEFLMGRMHRALMEDAKALSFQEAALQKDPDYGPALYERIILISRKHRTRILEAAAGWQDPEKTLRERIVKDLNRLLQLSDPRVGPANLLIVQGIQAAHQSRIPESQSLLNQALEKDPLLEEGWEMLNHTITASLWTTRDRKAKEKLYRQMDELYTQGLSHDRGYLPHWLGRGFARSKLGQWLQESNMDGQTCFVGAEEDYAEAKRLDPGSLEALLGHGFNCARWARYRYRAGADPSPECAKAIASLDEALKRDPGNGTAWYLWGVASHCRGYYRFKNGGDPRADFTEGERHVTEAMAHLPKDATLWCERAESRTWRGKYRARVGEDPVPDYDGADQDFTKSIELDTSLVWARMARGEVRLLRAEHREASGKIPEARADYLLAAADYEESLRASPGEESSLGPSLRRARDKAAALKE